MSNKKGAFIILRVSQEFKDELTRRATKAKRTLSAYIRDLLNIK